MRGAEKTVGGALPKYREAAKCQRVWARRLASLMCVCTCGRVFACIVRIPGMCVKTHMPVLESVNLCEEEDYTAINCRSVGKKILV